MIGFLADRFGLPETLSLLVLASLAVVALGGRATATRELPIAVGAAAGPSSLAP